MLTLFGQGISPSLLGLVSNEVTMDLFICLFLIVSLYSLRSIFFCKYHPIRGFSSTLLHAELKEMFYY